MRIDVPAQDRVVEHYGVQHQTMLLMEECSELAKAASKIFRARIGSDDRETIMQRREELTEEIAHVLICITQMMDIYEISEMHVQDYVSDTCRRVRRGIGDVDG